MKQPAEERLLDRGFWIATGALAVISAALMALVVAYPIDRLLPEASSASIPIDFIFKFMAFFSVPIFVFINGYLIYFSLRHRVRKGDPPDATGSPIHDHRGLETWWTIIPSTLMVSLGIISYLVMPKYYLVGRDSAATIEAIGHQFYFEFRYPGLPHTVVTELHLPLGVPVTIDTTSAEADESRAVIHSFWAPEFRVKQDMVPGMVVPIHLTAIKLGRYRIVCGEYCGLGHSKMWGWIVVESKPDFDRWFAQQQKMQAAAPRPVTLAAGDAVHGRILFTQKCAACHSAAPFAQRKVGPGLANLFNDPDHPNLVDEKPPTPANVADIIEHGFQGDLGIMPNMQANGLAGKDVADLVAYLKTLK